MDIPFPDKKYNIIYADPAWSYQDKAAAGNRGASFKYQTQSQEWICNLPVNTISDDDAILFMWVVDSHLDKSFKVIRDPL